MNRTDLRRTVFVCMHVYACVTERERESDRVHDLSE